MYSPIGKNIQNNRKTSLSAGIFVFSQLLDIYKCLLRNPTEWTQFTAYQYIVKKGS